MFKYPKTNLDWLEERTIFLTRHGSHAYGLNTETSDEDFKGVAIPPEKYFHGFLNHFEQAVWHDPDMAVYDVRKFCALAADCNPSIIEVLFTDPEDHIIVSVAGEMLLEQRDTFISKKAKHTFSGYAISQLKRIKNHHRWLRNPPKAPPTRAEMGLPERTVIPADQLKAAEAMIRKKVEQWNVPIDELDPAAKVAVQDRLARALAEVTCSMDLYHVAGRSLGFSENFLELLDRERGYHGRKVEWEQYQNWKATRNPTRHALEEQYGYDTKHGMHLVRLLRMGREILETGKVIVRRPDREELLAIRNGAWPYEKLVEWAEEQDRELTRLYETSTAVPTSPNRNDLDYICQAMVEDAMRNGI